MSRAYSETRKLEATLFRILGLLRRLGLPEGIEALIQKIQRVIMTVRLMHSAMIAAYAASGPIGWTFAGVGIGAAYLSFTDIVSNSGLSGY